MMDNMIRKNITLSQSVFDSINNYAKKNGITFSEFLRNAALKEIKKNEEMDLLDFFNANCEYCDEEEMLEIETMNIDFEDLSGKELTLDDLL